MFEPAFKNIDDVLRKEAGCTAELDCTEQTSWLLFLKYLDAVEQDKTTEAELEGRKYTRILDQPHSWESPHHRPLRRPGIHRLRAGTAQPGGVRGEGEGHISTRFSSKQQVFLDFVLAHYVSAGLEELAQEKLTPLLRLQYRDPLAAAVNDLGKPDEIGKVFAGFQKYLYVETAA